MIYAVYILLFAGAFWVVAQLIATVFIRFYRKSKAIFDTRVNELGFIVSKEVVYYNTQLLYVDDINKKWIARDDVHGKNPRIFDFEDVIDFEMIDDGHCIARSGLGGAIVGGALFGVNGAIAGGIVSRETRNTCASLNVVIRLNKLECPQIMFDVIGHKVNRSSHYYRRALEFAQQLLSTLTYIEHNKTRELEERL